MPCLDVVPTIARVGELRIRAMTAADAAAVDDLLTAAEAVDRTDEHFNLEDVLEEVENPMIDVSRDWLVAEVDGRVVAQSRLLPRAPAAGRVSVAVDGTVDPAHRRQGIGSRLVPLMVERAREYVRELGEDLVPVITGHAPSDNADQAALFARSGLHPDRWSFVMIADLATWVGDEPEVPDGYRLTTWEGIDHEEMREAHNRAFAGHYGFTPWTAQMWDQWVASVRSLRSEHSLVLRGPEGDIAAYVQTSEFEAMEEAIGVKEAYVAKVGTLEAHRRRGLAALLLSTALARYRAAGFDRAALDVDSENPTGALGLYERVGFRTTMRWTSYRST